MTTTKLSLISIAAVAACTAFAAPAFAQHRAAHPADAYAQASACVGQEPGNPYNKQTDFWGWSAWRDRGGWDARNDYGCTSGSMTRGEF
jgi:hypothetical protein